MARPSPQTERLVRLVDALAARPDQGLSLTELAHHLEVTPATCHPMVAELTEQGWLRRHPVRRTYRLGPAFIALGRAAAGAIETQELARTALVELQRTHRVDGLVLVPGDDVLTVVDLVPDRRDSGLAIGDQISFRAPLGASVAAFAPPVVVEHWLTASAPPTAMRRSYVDLLDAVRERGYAVELTGTVDARIYEVLAQIGGRFADGSGGGDPTAARLRGLLDEIVGELGGLEGFHPVHLDPEASYQVGTMSAPVFDPDGDVALVMAVRGRPERVSGAEVQRLGSELVAAADEVTRAAGGRRAPIAASV